MPALLYGFVLNYETCKMYYETRQVHIRYRNKSDVQEGLTGPEQFEEIWGSMTVSPLPIYCSAFEPR